MKYRMLVVGFVDGRRTAHDGRWVKSFDPEFDGGRRGLLVTTDRADRAMEFDTVRDALEFWKQVPASRPVRESDGKPNRPLTAYTMEMESVPPMLRGSM